MRVATSNLSIARGNLLPHSPLAAAVAHRAERVVALVVKRRKLAIAYRHGQTEDQRIALAQVDGELALHNIDIPAIQRRTNRK